MDQLATLKIDLLATLKIDLLATLKIDLLSTLKIDLLATLKIDLLATALGTTSVPLLCQRPDRKGMRSSCMMATHELIGATWLLMQLKTAHPKQHVGKHAKT